MDPLAEAVISAFFMFWCKACDSVFGAGMGQFLSGVTDEMKQSHRQRLFTVDHKNLVDVAER